MNIAEEFYKAFNIPEAEIEDYGSSFFWDTNEVNGKRYAPITDRVILKLICAYNKAYPVADDLFIPTNFDTIEEDILKYLVRIITDYEYEFDKDWLIEEVQSILMGD